MDIPAQASVAVTLADLVAALGHIPLDRIRYEPLPGTASEDDVLRIEASEHRLCELIEGVLVEKPMGFRESLLAVALAQFLRSFVLPGNLGLVTGADGMIRLFPGLVRIPDVAFISWDNVPGNKVPEDPIPQLVPDLAVEVLSRTNTLSEMQRKREEYFAAGVRLVWMVDPDDRTVRVFRSPEDSTLYSEEETLDGGDLLPSFSLPLRQLFAELDRCAD